MRFRQHADFETKHGAVGLLEGDPNRNGARRHLDERAERAHGENRRAKPGSRAGTTRGAMSGSPWLVFMACALMWIQNLNIQA